MLSVKRKGSSEIRMRDDYVGTTDGIKLTSAYVLEKMKVFEETVS